MIEQKFTILLILVFLQNFCVISSREQGTVECLNDLKEILTGLESNKKWAVKMIDASAKIPNGIYEGNLVDYGNFEECLSVKDDERSIRGQHCMLKLQIPQKIFNLLTNDSKFKINLLNARKKAVANGFLEFGMYLGVCIPDSCPVNNIDLFLKKFLVEGRQHKFLFPYGNTKKELEKFLDFAVYSNFTILKESCKTIEDESKLSNADWIAIGIFSLIIFTVLLITLIDFLKRQNGEIYQGFLKNLSLYKNVNILFHVKNGQDIKCLHGMKVISIIWIIIAHRFVISISVPLTNWRKFSEWTTRPLSMIIINADKGVDTFFVISGLLVSYVLLRYTNKNIKLNVPLLYLARFIRLTPVLAVVVLLHITLFDNFTSGPNTSRIQKYQNNCIDSWWITLLHIQSYFPENMCVGVSWYLSIDTQLYCISIIILIALRRWKKIMISMCLLLTMISMVISFSYSWFYEANAFRYFGAAKASMHGYYVQVYCRYGPYVMGVLLGYYLHHKELRQEESPRLNKLIVTVLWLISGIVACATIFAPIELMNKPYNVIEHSIYNGIHRHAWSMAMCWIIFACHQGYGGFINNILSHTIFQPLGKLTYSMFLIHTFYQTVIVINNRRSIYFDVSEIFVSSFGDVIVTLILSLILVLFVEFPLVLSKENIIKENSTNTTNTNISEPTELKEDIEMNKSN